MSLLRNWQVPKKLTIHLLDTTPRRELKFRNTYFENHNSWIFLFTFIYLLILFLCQGSRWGGLGLEDTFGELFLSFYHTSSRDQTQVIWLSGKHIYPLSHLVCPKFTIFKTHNFSSCKHAHFVSGSVCIDEIFCSQVSPCLDVNVTKYSALWI